MYLNRKTAANNSLLPSMRTSSNPELPGRIGHPSMNENSLEARLRSAIRDIPDFPQPGILFRDITPVLQDPAMCKEIVESLANEFLNEQIDGIVGVESRGFLFGMMLAGRMKVPFIPVRKKGKLPFKTLMFEYKLEYGSAIVEIHEDAIKPGSRLLIHDDLLATGGTASAAAELITMLGGNVAGFAFLISLDFLNGKSLLQKYSNRIFTLVNY